MTPTPSTYGLLLGAVGALFIGLGLNGGRRMRHLREWLSRYAAALAPSTFSPARLLSLFMDLFYGCRGTFWLFVLLPLPLLPAYSVWTLTHLPYVADYLQVLLIVWAAVLGFTLLLFVPAALTWIVTLRRPRYPRAVDHLVAVAAFPWRWALPLTLPAALLFLAFPIAVFFIAVRTALIAAAATTVILSQIPLRMTGALLLLLSLLLQLYFRT
jgi:hypothetical protein